MVSSKTQVEYLEKYAVAPSPSRDYYGIKVHREQVTLYTWKISHGPHTNPIVRVTPFRDFDQDKTLQDEIQRIFGDSTFRHVRTIAKGNGNTLLTLPKNLVKKLCGYLRLRDVLNLTTVSRMGKEVFNGDPVWEGLYRRQKMGLIYRDERERAASCGWKELFRERKMHKPAKDRKLKKLTNVHQPLVRPSTALEKSPTRSSPAVNNAKQTVSTSKLFPTSAQTPRYDFQKTTRNYLNRKSYKIIEDCRVSGVKKPPSDETGSTKSNARAEMRHGKPEVPEKTTSKILTSCLTSGAIGNLAKNRIPLKRENLVDGNSGRTGSRTSTTVILGPRRDPCEKSSCSSIDGGIREKISSDGNGKLSARLRKKGNSPGIGRKTRGVHKTENMVLAKNSLGVTVNRDFGLDDLIRASITEKYLNSGNLLESDFWKNQNRGLDLKFSENFGKVASTVAQEFSKNNSANVDVRKSAASLYRKSSTHGKPGSRKKCDGLSSGGNKSETKIRNFRDTKLKPNGNEKNARASNCCN